MANWLAKESFKLDLSQQFYVQNSMYTIYQVKKSLILVLNKARDGAQRVAGGSKFHRMGPVCRERPCLSMSQVFVLATHCRLLCQERRAWPGWYNCSKLRIYCRVRTCRAWYMRTKILQSTQAGTGSQCSSLCPHNPSWQLFSPLISNCAFFVSLELVLFLCFPVSAYVCKGSVCNFLLSKGLIQYIIIIVINNWQKMLR